MFGVFVLTRKDFRTEKVLDFRRKISKMILNLFIEFDMFYRKNIS